MDFLFKELQPITKNFFFIEGDINIIANTFIDWQTPLLAIHNNRLESNIIREDLKHTLLRLSPLTTVEARRYVLIPTNSKWIAFFDNGNIGTDSSAPNVIGDFLKTKVIRAVYDNRTEDTIFDYSDYAINENGLIRSINAIKESKWKFETYGTPLSFENLELYNAKKIKDKFNLNILNNYLLYFDIDFLNKNYYKPKDGAIFIDKIGSMFPTTKEIELNI